MAATSSVSSFDLLSYLSRSTQLSDATTDLPPVKKPSHARYLTMRLKAAAAGKTSASVVEAKIRGKWQAARLLSRENDEFFYFRVAPMWRDEPVGLHCSMIRRPDRLVARRSLPNHGPVKKPSPEELKAMEEEEEEEDPEELVPNSSVGSNDVEADGYESDATSPLSDDRGC